MTSYLETQIELVGDALEATETTVKVTNVETFKKNIYKLVEISALKTGAEAATARYLVRGAAIDLGVFPASIHELYIARGEGKVPNTFTVPAINLRVLPFDAARAVFRAANKINAGAIIFEIARSEIGYTDQRPSEYTTNILAAAVVEDYVGPVYIQGDHFQISAGRYAKDADTEVQAVKDLSKEAVHAGFYNIDIDTSTLVDLSKETTADQQQVNTSLSAELSAYVRELEPEGVTISIGGEIGEVGGQNSTEEELRVYTEQFNEKLEKLAPGTAGLSKISIQTGTSHGGVVLPDGSIAQVSVDFGTLLELSRIARDDYGMAGAVQHGASTLPQDAFGKFVEAEACEVHLATNFQNIFYDFAPEDLVKDIYTYLGENHNNERKPDMTDDQFHYKTRKRAIGPFKPQIWALPAETKKKITEKWDAQFQQLFDSLAIADTKKFADQFTTKVNILPSLDSYIEFVGGEIVEEDTSDLAD
jgi:fructose/tagatose bisphosphate aldolase